MNPSIALGGRVAASLVRTVLPLSLRKRAAIWIGQQGWVPDRQWRALHLIRDLAERDPEAYHRFLWSHHLAYAESYEPEMRFGPANIRPERHLLFQILPSVLSQDASGRDIQSVLEVGCSLGHLLRFIETDVFPAAQVLEGLDIDEYAVASGNDWLRRQGSKVRLIAADMTRMDDVLGPEKMYDIVLCAGVLMYLKEEQAAGVVDSMLRRTRRLLVLSGLSHPDFDNRELFRSEPRPTDGAFRHNLDAMVRRCGEKVLYRRWDATAPPGWNPPYFVFCTRRSASNP